MKRILSILFFISSFAFGQYDFQQLCLQCAEAGGYYCGDDPANWTQYSPNGCVPNGPDLFYLNDGWQDCVDGSDEAEAVPTTLADCGTFEELCDTVYLTQFETIYETIFDTIIEIQVIEEIDTVYVYEDVLDTLYIYETETILVEEYIDCDTGMPCNNTAILEIIKKSKEDNYMYNLVGQPILRPKGIYIQNGKIKYKLN
jgi:hypothetical protein